MSQPQKPHRETGNLPAGAGVMIGAALGAVVWLGAIALFW